MKPFLGSPSGSISGLVLKNLKGQRLAISKGQPAALPASSRFALTAPPEMLKALVSVRKATAVTVRQLTESAALRGWIRRGWGLERPCDAIGAEPLVDRVGTGLRLRPSAAPDWNITY